MTDFIPSMTPLEHYRKELFPNYNDYLLEPSSEHRMKNAATAIQNWVEWTYRYFEFHNPPQLLGAKDPKSYCQELAKQGCGDLWEVWEIALGRKHRFLKDPDHAFKSRSSTGSVFETDGGLYLNSLDRPIFPMIVSSVDYLRTKFDLSLETQFSTDQK